jgi:hypothetical protein
MEIRFKTCFSRRYNAWDYSQYLAIVLICLLIYLHIYWLSILLAGYIIIAGLISRKLSKTSVLGELAFYDDFLESTKNETITKFELNSVKKVVLEFVAIKGEMLAIHSLPSRGCDNRIIIWTHETKIKFNILCEDDQDFNRLGFLKRFLNQKNITVTTNGL